ncbi:4868_t:CDS:2, partial [Scutellospora calospora]
FLAEEEEELRRGEVSESNEESESESNDEDYEEEWEEEAEKDNEFDTEALEYEIWKKEIASEYHQKRINLIAQQGGLSTNESPLPQPTERSKKVSKFKAARLQGKFNDT